MTSEIKNRFNDAAIAGPACAVKVFPGDNLMVYKALDIAHPGDIIVVDDGGPTMTAWGPGFLEGQAPGCNFRE